MDEDTIVEALIRQDRAAFKQLVARYHRLLIHVVENIVGKDSAEDVVQEAWLAIYQNLPKFERRSSLKTWMFRIATNKALTRWRKDKKEATVSDAFDGKDGETVSFYDRFDQKELWTRPVAEWDENDPQKVLASRELKDCIDRVVKALPDKQRMVFTLSQMQGHSPENICNLLQVSASNVKVLLHRARLKLFEHIENFQETGEC